MDSGWADEIDAGVRATPGSILIVCPFIKRRTAERLLSVRPPADFRIVTRFDLNAFNAGVSDLDALELLLQNGAKIRGIVGVHSKMYVFGSTRAIVTSANLTESAMFKNKEFGFTTDDPDISLQCHNYFKGLWDCTKRDLTASAIEEWRLKLAPLRAGARIGSQLPVLAKLSGRSHRSFWSPPQRRRCSLL
nr:phospholipase D-like domain-containing protein [Rhizobium leguminosarum]